MPPQHEAPLEFDKFKIRIVQGLPQSEKLNNITTAQPVVYCNRRLNTAVLCYIGERYIFVFEIMSIDVDIDPFCVDRFFNWLRLDIFLHGAARGDPSGGLDAYEGESSLLPDSVHGKEPMHPDKGKQQFLSLLIYRLQKIVVGLHDYSDS